MRLFHVSKAYAWETWKWILLTDSYLYNLWQKKFSSVENWLIMEGWKKSYKPHGLKY